MKNFSTKERAGAALTATGSENVKAVNPTTPASALAKTAQLSSSRANPKAGRPARRRPSLNDILMALSSGQYGMLRHDRFRDQIVIDRKEGRTELDSAELTHLLSQIEANGLGKVNRSDLEKAAELFARGDPFDSAIEWLDNLTEWDGEERVEYFLPKYLGTKDTAYERAVGRYIWTAMVARILEPGCKVDMVPVLVGRQGVGKSTVLELMAPTQDHWGEVCLTDRPYELARKAFAKTSLVWEEMRGIRGRADADAVKTFITSPYCELPCRGRKGLERYPRRFLLSGTSNRKDFLKDITGHRRYLPFDTRDIQLARVRRDKEQLWAEALAVVYQRKATGMPLADYKEAEGLAPAVHQEYVDPGLWVDDEKLHSWLDTGVDRFRTDEALRIVGAFQVTKQDRHEMTKSLVQLGLHFRQARIPPDSRREKRWHRDPPKRPKSDLWL